MEEILKMLPHDETKRMIFRQWIEQYGEKLLERMPEGHFTASGFIFNPEKTKTLMVFHNIYQSWAWTGGHADGEEDLLQTALREVREETGLANIKPVNRDIFSIEIITVDGHIKSGRYVSSHLHLNVTYLIEADEDEALHIKADENSDIGWFEPQKLDSLSDEKWMKEVVYAKLQSKLKGE